MNSLLAAILSAPVCQRLCVRLNPEDVPASPPSHTLSRMMHGAPQKMAHIEMSKSGLTGPPEAFRAGKGVANVKAAQTHVVFSSQV